MLHHVILALVAAEPQADAETLMTRYRERLGMPSSPGSIYEALRLLVADGHVVAAAGSGDPRRATYGVSDAGREVLAAWLAAPIDGPGCVAGEEVAWRLAVVGDLDGPAAVAVLETLRRQLWDLAKRVERERARTAAGGHSRQLVVVRQALLVRRALQLAADIEIVDELMESLTTRPSAAPPPPTVRPERR